MTIPLWLDLGGLRVVRACWDAGKMADISAMLTADHRMTPEFVELSSRKGHLAYEGAETDTVEGS